MKKLKAKLGILLDVNIMKDFREIADKEHRSLSNLAEVAILKYVENFKQ